MRNNNTMFNNMIADAEETSDIRTYIILLFCRQEISMTRGPRHDNERFSQSIYLYNIILYYMFIDNGIIRVQCRVRI